MGIFPSRFIVLAVNRQNLRSDGTKADVCVTCCACSQGPAQWPKPRCGRVADTGSDGIWLHQRVCSAGRRMAQGLVPPRQACLGGQAFMHRQVAEVARPRGMTGERTVQSPAEGGVFRVDARVSGQPRPRCSSITRTLAEAHAARARCADC